MIEPTVGRVVHYRPAAHEGARMIHNGDEPLAAHIAKVHSDRMVNLMVIGSDGVTHGRTSVPLLQDDDQPPEGQSYCEWMPFQKGQAQATEAAEREAAALREGAGAEGDADDGKKGGGKKR